MNSSRATEEKINAALQRLGDVVNRKLIDFGNAQANVGSDSLKAEIAKLKEENRCLRDLNQDSAQKLDLAIDRMNNVINAS